MEYNGKIYLVTLCGRTAVIEKETNKTISSTIHNASDLSIFKIRDQILLEVWKGSSSYIMGFENRLIDLVDREIFGNMIYNHESNIIYLPDNINFTPFKHLSKNTQKFYITCVICLKRLHKNMIQEILAYL